MIKNCSAAEEGVGHVLTVKNFKMASEVTEYFLPPFEKNTNNVDENLTSLIWSA